MITSTGAGTGAKHLVAYFSPSMAYHGHEMDLTDCLNILPHPSPSWIHTPLITQIITLYFIVFSMKSI